MSANASTTPSMLNIHLRFSKCDQFGKGVDVYVGRSGNELCPVTAILAYTAVRGKAHCPFFQDTKGKPLTKARFVTEVRRALSAIGLEQGLYAGHSFRIGAATVVAQAGLEDSTIRALGRWNSSAFLLYVRSPRERLAAMTQSIAKLST